MHSPLSVSNASARWRLAALPLCFVLPVGAAFAGIAWRYSGHHSLALGFGALALATVIIGSAWAFRNRIGGRLSRVRLDGDVLHLEPGQREIALSDISDLFVRDMFPLEVVMLRLSDGSRLAFAFSHRNALTRLRSPMLVDLLARMPDVSIRERAPRLGGDVAALPWWARCPELLAIPLGGMCGVAIATLCVLPMLIWPTVFDAPPWALSLIYGAGAGVVAGAMTFLAIRSWCTPPDVRLWKGVLLVRCKRNGRLVERCHPLDGVAEVRYSRAFGRRRRVCLFAIELRGVLATRARRITFPAQSSQAVLRTLRWPGAEAIEQ